MDEGLIKLLIKVLDLVIWVYQWYFRFFLWRLFLPVVSYNDILLVSAFLFFLMLVHHLKLVIPVVLDLPPTHQFLLVLAGRMV